MMYQGIAFAPHTYFILLIDSVADRCDVASATALLTLPGGRPKRVMHLPRG
jgi:hypothetical protein